MTEDQPEDPPDDTSPADAAPVFALRGQSVILASRVAEAFGVETREVTQAVKRNAGKFLEIHAFQVTEEERAEMRSQAVIAKPGRGGTRALPWVFSIKGVVRLATIMDAPAALDATDRIIDLFLEVRAQLIQGRTEITVSHPSRLVPDQPAAKEVAALKRKLLGAVTKLLDTEVDPRSRTTVRDELGEVSGNALTHLKEVLKTRGLENEKLHAEVALILEKAREIRERTAADTRKTDAETEAQILKNIETRITLVERALKLADEMEPNAVVTLLDGFPAQGLLPAPAAPARRPRRLPAPDAKHEET
jgi:hypothetical protein